MKEMLKQSPNAESGADDSQWRSQLMRRLLRWNRCLSVLENVMIVLRAHGDAEKVPDRSRSRIFRRSFRLAEIAIRHIKIALQQLADDRLSRGRQAGKYYSDIAADPAVHAHFNHVMLSKAREEFYGAAKPHMRLAESGVQRARSARIIRRAPRRGFIFFFVAAALFCILREGVADSVRSRGLVDGELKLTGYDNGKLLGEAASGKKLSWPIDEVDLLPSIKLPRWRRRRRLWPPAGAWTMAPQQQHIRKRWSN